MEHSTAVPYTAPRRSAMARKLANLPPISTGLSERPIMSMNEKHNSLDDDDDAAARSPSTSSIASSSSGACHNMLPCIMITPSSPIHEYDYEIHYFESPDPKTSSASSLRCRGFLSSVRQAFFPSSSSASTAIALPDSPSYGYTPQSAPDRSWSASSRRFRMVLALAAVLFFALHLIAIPKMHNGVYEVFSTPHGGAAHMMDDAVASWETVSDWQPAPPQTEDASAHSHTHHNHHADVRPPHHAGKPVDGVDPARPASSLD